MNPEFDRRSRTYLIFRLLIILTGIGLVAFYQVSLGRTFGPNTFPYLYTLLGVYLALAVSLLVTYPRWKGSSSFLRFQVVGDFVLQSLLIWGTGGVLSIFSPLLFVTLVAATSVISARGAFILATIATVFLTGTTVASALGISPVGEASRVGTLTGGRSSTYLAAYLIGSVLALYTISGLGSRFSHGLRSIQSMQSEILENMAEGLIAVDRDGAVVQLNREARNLLGVPDRSSVRGGKLRLSDLFPSPELGELRAAFGQDQRRRFSTVLRTPDGVGRPVEVKISSVNGDPGEARYRIGLISDLTLKREIEAAERRIQKLEDLHVMALGIAHEIRNPLASIRGCVQEIGRLCRTQESVSAYMEIVCRESDRLDNTLEEFLRYARSGPVDLKPLDIVQVIDDAVILLGSRADFGSRTVRWSPPAERPRIFGDRNALMQVFLNLGLNAIEATRPEGGRIDIALRQKVFAAIRQGGSGRDVVPGIEIEVRDDGLGVGPADAEKMFTPFFTTKPRGNGLGLFVVERIVRDHMGVVDMASEQGRGTAVSVWLPALRDPSGGQPTDGSGEKMMREAERAVSHA